MECTKSVIFQWINILDDNSNYEKSRIGNFIKFEKRYIKIQKIYGKVIWEGVLIDLLIREQELSSLRFSFRVLKVHAVDAFVYESAEYLPLVIQEGCNLTFYFDFILNLIEGSAWVLKEILQFLS